MSPALVEALIIAAIKYGPEFVQAVITLFKKETISIDDVEALFANVKPYESYGIKDANK